MVLSAPVFKTNILDQHSLLGVAVNVKANITHLFHFIGQQLPQYQGWIEKIQKKNPAPHETCCNAFKGAKIVSSPLKIAKTGEKTKNSVKVIDPKWFAHIVSVKSEMIPLVLLRMSYTGWRQIEASHIKPFVCQVFAVSTSAAGEIEQPGTRGGVPSFQQVIYKGTRFMLIALLVQHGVVGGVKPGCVPGFFACRLMAHHTCVVHLLAFALANNQVWGRVQWRHLQYRHCIDICF